MARFSHRGNIGFAVEHLHLGERENLFLAEKFNPDKTPGNLFGVRRSDRGADTRDDKVSVGIADCVARGIVVRQHLEPQRRDVFSCLRWNFQVVNIRLAAAFKSHCPVGILINDRARLRFHDRGLHGLPRQIGFKSLCPKRLRFLEFRRRRL